MTYVPTYAQQTTARAFNTMKNDQPKKPKGKLFSIPEGESTNTSVNAIGILIHDQTHNETGMAVYEFMKHGSYMTVTTTPHGKEQQYYKTVGDFAVAHSMVAANPKYGSAEDQVFDYAGAKSINATSPTII